MKQDFQVVVRPVRQVTGSLRMPGDKSVSHRYAILGAIAEGPSRLQHFSAAQDCTATLHCLRMLGCEWKHENDAILIEGRGLQLTAPGAPLDCGNSGSTMRMLSGILAGQKFSSELFGDASLSQRPMARIIEPLTLMGANIHAVSADGRPPLRIAEGKLHGIPYRPPVASAQVKTSLLFAGLFANGETRIEEPVRTRDHGELALRAFGAEVKRQGNAVSILGGQRLHGIEATVPGDLSSAAFFLCAAALFPGSQLVVESVLMNPTRARLLDVLMQMGLGISVMQLEEHHGELTGTLEVKGGPLKGVVISGATTAALIDEIPVLAAIAPYTDTGLEVHDARELRVKESDRIAAIAANLRAMGAQVEEREDGLRIPGNQKLHGAAIDCFGDHRIAMAFAVAALRAEGETQIRNAGAAAVSFPEFFAELKSVTVA